MLKTNREIKTSLKGRDVVVPAGQPVVSCNDSTGQYFVENFASFISERTQPILFHDATHYGIRVNGADVSDIEQTIRI